MSDNGYDDLFDNDDTIAETVQSENGPKALRDAYKAMKAEKAKAEAELNQLRTEKRQTEIGQKLVTAGLPAEAAKFATGADDIDAWIEENRGLFGVAGDTATTDDSAQTGTPSLTPEQIAELQSTRVVTPGTFQPGSREAVVSKLDAATSKEDFYQRLREVGM